MKYFLPLDDQTNPGRIPVLDENYQAHYIALGHLNQVNSTVFLNDINRNEVGRISNNRGSLTPQFILRLQNDPEIKVKLIKLGGVRMYYLTQINFWVVGNSKSDEYIFRHGREKIAKSTIMVTNLGPTLQVDISNQTSEVAVILTSLIFNQPGFIEQLLHKKKTSINYQPTF